MAGRPFEKEPAPRELPPCDPKTVAPLNSDGFPDLVNYMPTRLVPKDEAIARGWPLFYQAETCRYGHRAPRYVSNPRQCIDCFRTKRGKTPLTAVAAQPDYKRPYTQRAEKAPDGQPVAVRTVEPDRLEKLFLAAYADVRDIDLAASRVGMTGAQVYARLSWSTVFSNAVKALETQLGIVRIADDGPFEWSDAKRERLVAVLVDTGDIATARDAIRVTPSEYFKEVERNADFGARIEEATPLAVRALEEKATQLALGGNDKLLQKLLTAKLPEYRERLDLNVNEMRNLSDAQLNAQLARLVARHSGPAIEAEFREVDPVGQIAAPDAVERDRASREAEPNSDLL